MQDFKDGLPIGNLSVLQKMSLGAFRQRFSLNVTPPKHFSGYEHTHFVTNEYDYPTKLNEITTKGGLHLAVMGGLDPVFGQVAVAKPDLTLAMDVNDQAIDWTIDGRVLPLDSTTDGNNYWDKVNDFHRDVIIKTVPNRYDFPSNQDMRLGGWSSDQYFNVVQQAWQEGKIKLVAADIMDAGLDLGMTLSREIGIPIRLVYLSNILDYGSVSRKLPSFKEKLRKGTASKVVDQNGQVIIFQASNTNILSMESFLQT